MPGWQGFSNRQFVLWNLAHKKYLKINIPQMSQNKIDLVALLIKIKRHSKKSD